jgi:outer membrane protein
MTMRQEPSSAPGAWVRLVILVCSFCLRPVQPAAQPWDGDELGQPNAAAPVTGFAVKGDWDVTIGIGAAMAPKFTGADKYTLRPTPLGSITYRDRIFLGPDGFGVNAIDRQGLRAGPVIGYEGGRKQSDDSHLQGLGNIQPSITAGLFASYDMGQFQIRGTIRQSAIHAANGLRATIGASYRQPLPIENLTLTVGPEVGLGDGSYMRTFFGVSSDQSARSGLPIFRAQSGLEEAGIAAALTYRYSEHILLRSFLGIHQLLGDAARSPIVQSATEGVIGLGVAYHFCCRG